MSDIIFHPGLVVKSPIIPFEEAAVYSVDWDVELKQTQKFDKLLLQISGFHTPHIQFGTIYYTSAFLVRGFNPKKSVAITYHKTEGIINYRNRRLKQSELLILTPDEEMDLVISDINTAFTIAIDEEFFQKSFYEYYGLAFDGKIKKRMLLDPKQEQTFINFLHYWINHLPANHEVILKPEYYEKIEEEIIHTLFNFIVIDGEKTKGENKILKKARELLEESLLDDLKLSDIANHLNINQRTLEYTFKQNLGITPKNYLQIMRLHAIRNELRTADPNTTKVSDIALKYAFFHMGHFSSEYKKLFGESPLQTLKKR